MLNEQITNVRSTSASLTVNMIHVFITQANILNIPIGAQIIVSHASSGLTSGVQGTLDGVAYGTQATIGHLISSGPTAKVTMGCLGTNGALKTKSIAQVQVPPLFSVGEVVDTALGTVNSTSAAGELTSTIQAVDVVSSLVTASLVKADAHASSTGGTFTFSDDGQRLLTSTSPGSRTLMMTSHRTQGYRSPASERSGSTELSRRRTASRSG